MSKQVIGLTVGALTLSVGVNAVNAQEITLEEIVITAQKRAQSLGDVPLAVAVLSADTLERQNVTNIGALQSLVPNLHVAQTPFNPIVNIRGVGSGGGSRTFEQSVATYVDGVYAGRANQFLNPFFDVERIEVVRGPQGVLFGVNAVAGGISVINKEPADHFEGHVAAGYEFEHESYHVDGAVSLPVSDTLAIRLAATTQYQGPYIKNVVPGGPKLETNSDLARAMVRWKASDDLTLKFTAQTSSRKTDGSPFQMYALGFNTLPIYGYAIDPTIEDGQLDFKRSSVTDEFTDIDADNFTLNIDWQLGDHTLTSITGYSQYDFKQAVAAAAVPVPLGAARAKDHFKQTYEELRLASPTGQFLEYLVGGTYYKQKQKLYQGIDLAVLGTPVGQRNGMIADNEAYAAFGQLTFNFTEHFRVVAGARYTNVEKQADYLLGASDFGAPLDSYTFSPSGAALIAGFPPLGWLTYLDPTNPAPQLTSHKIKLSKVDPSISLQWDATSAIHPYFTYSRATKAGGFDDQNKSSGLDNLAYNPENARSFELGSKFTYSRLQLNADVFHTKFEDLQVTSAQGNNVRTTNAATITSKGLEIESRYQLTQGIRLGADFTYLDAKYDNFPGVGCIVPLDAFAVFTPCSIEGVASPAQTNAKGKRLEFAPKYTGSLHLDGTYALTGDFEFTYGGRAYYNDGYSMNANRDPIDVQGSYTLYDAYIGLNSTTQGWSVQLLGTNLSDEAVIEFGGYAGLGAGHQGIVAPGRQFTLTAAWNF